VSEKPLDFEILGPIHSVEVIAAGRGVRLARWLKKRYGGRHWRKMKGRALICERNGIIHEAELHWFEAHGVGKVQWKIKP
jgi:hypothetical protein